MIESAHLVGSDEPSDQKKRGLGSRALTQIYERDLLMGRNDHRIKHTDRRRPASAAIQAVARIFDGSPVVKQAHSNREIILWAGVSS